MEITNPRNEKGQFLKGHKGLKPKGALNKKTIEMKERLKLLLDSYDEDKMIEDMESLRAPDRMKVLIGLLEYMLPKLNKTDYTLTKESKEINVTLPDED